MADPVPFVSRLAPLMAALALCACTGGLAPRAVPRPVEGDAIGATLDAAAPAAADWPSATWWTRYGDPQLDALVEAALAGNPTLKIAEARLRLANAAAGVSEADLYPSAGLSASATRQHYTANGLVPKPVAGNWAWSNQLGVSLAYDIDFWGKHRDALAAAVGRVRATEAELANARLLLACAVVRAYLQFDEHFAEIAIARAALQRRLDLFELTRRRVAAAIDSQVELKLAEGEVPAARGAVAALESALALDRNRLAALTGRGADAGLALARPTLPLTLASGVPALLPAALIGRRPDVVAQRWQVEAAAREIAVARAGFYPDLNLSALAGYQSLGFTEFLTAGSRSVGVTPALTLPLFEGGRLRANLAGRDAAYDIAVEQYNQTTLDAVRDVVEQLLAIRWLAEQRNQARLAVQVSGEARQLAGERYRSGLATYLQVLSAELQLLSQQRVEVTLNTQALALDVALTQALGGGYDPAGALIAPPKDMTR